MASQLRPLRDAGPWARRYAYAYLTLLVLVPAVGILLGAWLGVIDVAVALSVRADLGLAVEWLALGVVAVFLFWTFVQVVRVTGIGFVRGAIRAAARIAHNYELPESQPEPPQSESETDSGGEDSQ